MVHLILTGHQAKAWCPLSFIKLFVTIMSVVNAAAKVLPTKIFMTIRIFAVAFALLMVYAVMPLSAHASSELTEAQIQSVASLVASLGAGDTVVANVKIALRGGNLNDFLKQKEETRVSTTPGGGQSSNNGNRPEEGGGFGTSAPSAFGQLVRNLNKGDRGEEVSHLQRCLRVVGDFDFASTTSYFGEKTEAALRRLQAREGIASSGDPSTTGFGALGPKTRQLLMARCRGNGGGPGSGSPASSTPQRPKDNVGSDDSSKPTCKLKASKEHVAPGESVTLTWESKNATWASTINGGRGEPEGSVTLTPTDTTTYLKLVYNATGQGHCSATVEVGTTTPAANQKVVVTPKIIDIPRVFSLMGSGTAAVMDGYLSLFGLALE